MQGVFVVDKDAHGKQRAKFVPVTTGITGATDIEVLSAAFKRDRRSSSVPTRHCGT